ncbi:MAG TPA: hypothetical protein VGD91_05080, partial [Trebonia sp.]
MARVQPAAGAVQTVVAPGEPAAGAVPEAGALAEAGAVPEDGAPLGRDPLAEAAGRPGALLAGAALVLAEAVVVLDAGAVPDA